ncbi:uncharacterized protein TRIADDRAFT_53561 [Trichoplax adhaerens]|uniref:Cubilin n=1 Tax=Trichoplax adhaerens TaxID=10228 RepID=B3RPJ1_TRIAD|nr:hypothetical protein TRIADDRAFT_53561 [Trichoplax adhaerens]EDV28197.1 hypothetical protein TRIADDRAFT_53561 [Trichoplax adhaerens]|eukprot:XP_002110031.1 hypothetical protein TRIADDRAFT_53561 [Trichoplax adhaerens]
MATIVSRCHHYASLVIILLMFFRLGQSQTRPRMKVESGNLVFSTGTNNNISFSAGQGGAILLNNVNVNGMQENRYIFAARNYNKNEYYYTDGEIEIGKVLALQKIADTVKIDECESSPCKNGGHCFDLYSKYFCFCTAGFTGPACEYDINECIRRPCRNGATCVNSPGSFYCTCAKNFQGLRCTVNVTIPSVTIPSACSLGNPCLHGSCVAVSNPATGQPNYRCICNAGWTIGKNPECNVDVNECNTRGTCSIDPSVTCTNTPGSYRCGPCPAGYSGNGITCTDINECLQNNGGCSRVATCTNTRGSRKCGPCPTDQGYIGNGLNCTYVGLCYFNNGGCAHNAKCTDFFGGGRTCTCPTGYTGNALNIGSGCNPVGGICSSGPCRNGGTCNPSPRSYTCTCTSAWTGTNCEASSNPCGSNPCQNGGTCTNFGSTFQCFCSSAFTGPICQYSQQVCGGSLTAPDGDFRFPPKGLTNYPGGATCTWIITVAPQFLVYLNFTQFQLEQSNQCTKDYVEIRDGTSSADTRIGRFCGSNVPTLPSPLSSTNSLWITFRSDGSIDFPGFIASYYSVPLSCGAKLTGITGTIRSPGYPGRYPSNRDCAWTISVPAGYIITLNFAAFSLQSSTGCNNDFLQIREGGSISGTLISNLCGQTLPRPIASKSNQLYLRLVTDGSITASGFLITYSATRSTVCGGVLTASSGSIVSPNYPGKYPNNAECIWTIQMPVGARITLNWQNIDIEQQDQCNFDYVELRNGNSTTAPFVGRYCGNNPPATFTSTGNNLYIKFKSDGSSSGNGFRLSYTLACGGILTSPTGSIQSLFYPSPYPLSTTCVWTIQVPFNQKIVLNFAAFEVEGAANCSGDYLELRSGSAATSPLITRLCGVVNPGQLIINNNNLYLRFTSDANYSPRGFNLTYSASSTVCGGFLTATTGTFSTPVNVNTGQYLNNAVCNWVIWGGFRKIIRMTFNSFSLQSSTNCSADKVIIYDVGSFNPNTVQGPSYCGSNIPPVFTSTRNVARLSFTSDSNVTSNGFSVNYKILDFEKACGGDLTSPTGVITSPNFPNQYPRGARCAWLITVPTGQQISLSFSNFSVGFSNCIFEGVTVYNGPNVNSPVLGAFCGKTLPPYLISRGNSLYILFRSSVFLTDTGFSLTYTTASSTCGGSLSTPTGVITSPNYPNFYSVSTDCVWTVARPPGNKLEILFTDMDLEQNANCSYDFVEIRDGSYPTSPLLGRYCGSSKPALIKSTSNHIRILFRSDGNQVSKGFRLQYTGDCGGTLTARNGFIASPNYPNSFNNLVNCTWRIQLPFYLNVTVSVTNFNVPSPDTNRCPSDFLAVGSGSDPNKGLISRLCGTSVPAPILITSSSARGNVWIRYFSDGFNQAPTFRLAYTSSVCGARLSGNSGTFSSPNYPNNYTPNVGCEYSIEAPLGKAIQVRFSTFQLGGTACSSSIEVHNGLSRSSPTLGIYCNNRNPFTITSSGNRMWLLFLSGPTAGRGFNATYTTTSTKCGGAFTSRHGSLSSPNYPSNYGANEECIWTITVSPHNIVQLSFNSFNIEGTNNVCNNDYLEVRQNSSTGALIGRYCGHNLPGTVRSLGNKMWIKFVSNKAVQAKGFHATYTTACGGILYAAKGGVLASPHYPSNYDNRSFCTWTLTTQPGFVLTLTFTNFNLQQSTGCTADFLQINNGPASGSPLLAKLCGSTLPGPFTSSGDALYLMFRTDTNVTAPGFRLVYSSQLNTCGGTLTRDRGIIDSPGYPTTYPPDVNCVWRINAPAGDTILISFVSLNMSNNCATDYIEVRDGNSNNATVLGKYCGTTVPATFSSTGQYIYVNMRTSANGFGTGFRLSYVIGCGSALTASTSPQLIQSLNYPNAYPTNKLCNWQITAPAGVRINLKFNAFDVRGSSNGCFGDYVEIFDGPTIGTPRLGIYCDGNAPNSPIVSSGNSVWIRFNSDRVNTGTGFELEYQQSNQSIVTCGGLLTNTTGMILSPNYPNNYPNNVICRWSIRVPSYNHIILTFNSFNLEGGANCPADSLTVMDGTSPFARTLGKFCGSQIPAAVQSSGDQMLLIFNSNFGAPQSGFNASYTIGCGSTLTGFAGSISSPGYPRAYGRNVNCTWIISQTVGRTVRVTFSTFHIRTTSKCSGDYIEFRNGDSLSSPIIGGRYCGDTAPLPIQSSDNKLLVRFVSGASGGGAGFRLSYQGQQLACGGTFTLGSTPFDITSPKFPQNYPSNVECEWTINAPANENIAINFKNFSLETSNKCFNDYVEIHDGRTARDPLLGKFCSTSLPPMVSSTYNSIYIKFRSNFGIVSTGFLATLSLGCGGYRIGQSGTIRSNGYPNDYKNNLNCSYVVQVTRGHTMNITFNDFSLQGGVGCPNDYVMVRDGKDASARLVGKYCGTSTPPGYTSSSDHAFINFVTDSSITNKGFSLRFAQTNFVCGGTLTTSSGAITTPNYPGGYPLNVRCTWGITVQPGRAVRLQFNNFNFPQTSGGCTANHHVRVYLGGSTTDSPYVDYCGGNLPPVTTSSGNRMIVVFDSTLGSTDNRGGFSASYTSNGAGCGGVVTGALGIIRSPNYPSNYPNNLDCVWNVNEPNGTVSLIFTTFRLEANSGACVTDIVQVFDGPSTSSPSLGTFCSSNIPKTLISTGSQLTLRFKTDSAGNNTGFQVYYKHGCGGRITAASGNITTPNYPSNYPANSDCLWILSVPFINAITLTFRSFNLEAGQNCQNVDYLRVRNGQSVTSPLLGTFCGTTVPSPITSSENHLYIRFHSDGSAQKPGTMMSWTSQHRACGAIFTSRRNTIYSTNYPRNYPVSTECSWIITTAQSEYISLQFFVFNMESSPNCANDYLAVYDDTHVHAKLLAKFCGSVVPQPFLVPTHKAKLVFSSNANVTGRGFIIFYDTVCGGSFNGSYGTIQSPNYPNQYPARRDCRWVITGPPGQTISLKFSPTSYGLEANANCIYDYIELRDGARSNDTLLGKFCGTNVPACNYHYTTSSGTFTTPNYPNNYRPEQDCYYTITVATGNVITLSFASINVASGVLCENDYVEIRSGLNSSAPLVGKFCGNNSIGEIISSGNSMYIHFHSDQSTEASGFAAQYTSGLGCNQDFNTENGTFQSPGYPSNYASNLNCIYKIQSSGFRRRISLTFTDFALESSSACVNDYIEIRNGPYQSSPLLNKYCGSTAPATILATTTSLWIKFHTNAASNMKGFNATWVTVPGCGQNVTATTNPQFITSPNYPNNYNNYADCRYFISAPVGKQIFYSFTSFSMSPSAFCNQDYIDLLEISSQGPYNIGRFCNQYSPQPAFSAANLLTMSFKSDASNTDSGFNMTYYIKGKLSEKLTAYSFLIFIIHH